MNLRSAILKVLQISLLVIIAIFVFLYLRGQWQILQSEELKINWGIFVIAQAGMTVGLGILPYCAWLCLAYLGEERTKSEVWRSFYVSSIAKYLPGSVWALPGRVYLYQRSGISPLISVAALFWEISILVLSAGMVSLLSLPLVMHYVSQDIVFIVIAVVGLGVMGLLISIRYGRRSIKLLIPARLRKIVLNREIRLKFSELMTVFLVHVAAWTVMGLSFAGSVYAVNPQFEAARILELIGLFAGSWVVGFLAIFAPGGIGVRDVLIGLGLSVFLSTPAPFVVTVLSRIGWTIAEIVGILLSSLWYARGLPELEK